MEKQALALVAAVAIVAASPLPVSVCALLANLAADCQPMPDCHSMPAGSPDSTLAAGGRHDCCTLSDAPPLPAKQKEVSVPVKVLQPAAEPSEQTTVSTASDFTAPSPPIVCPSDFQASLCVFLI
jgi:hypothetical protein